jgi:hypothetical protein
MIILTISNCNFMNLNKDRNDDEPTGHLKHNVSIYLNGTF